MQILLMRHGETWENREQRMQGRRDGDRRSHNTDHPSTSHPPTELSPHGQQQVIALGNRLKNRLGTQPRATSAIELKPSIQIYASPLHRSRETVTLLQATCDLAETQAKIRYDDRLAEIDLGILSGLTWAEAEIQHPKLCHTLLTQLEHHPIPQAESPEQCRQRAERFIQDLWLESTELSQVWIITHAGILAHLVAAILGSDRTWGMAIAPTALFDFRLNHDHWPTQTERLNTALWSINHFNDTAHLQTVTDTN